MAKLQKTEPFKCVLAIQKKIIWVYIFFIVPNAFAQKSEGLKLPAIFTDSLVLQQNMEIPVWGLSCSNCEVKIAFNGSTKTTIANKNGTWKITLPTTKAGGPFTLKVSDKNSNILLKDILVGEVWLCSGQSNMEFTFIYYSEGGSSSILVKDNF